MVERRGFLKSVVRRVTPTPRKETTRGAERGRIEERCSIRRRKEEERHRQKRNREMERKGVKSPLRRKDSAGRKQQRGPHYCRESADLRLRVGKLESEVASLRRELTEVRRRLPPTRHSSPPPLRPPVERSRMVTPPRAPTPQPEITVTRGLTPPRNPQPEQAEEASIFEVVMTLPPPSYEVASAEGQTLFLRKTTRKTAKRSPLYCKACRYLDRGGTNLSRHYLRCHGGRPGSQTLGWFEEGTHERVPAAHRGTEESLKTLRNVDWSWAGWD